jgi:hypothetical protein
MLHQSFVREQVQRRVASAEVERHSVGFLVVQRSQRPFSTVHLRFPPVTSLLKNPFSPRLLKRVQMQGGARCEVRGVLGPYAAAPRERANAADGPFSAAC